MTHAWPVMRLIDLDLDAEAEMVRLQEVIGAIRNMRSQHSVAPKQKISVVLVGGKEMESHRAVIESLAGVEKLAWANEPPSGEWVSAVVSQSQVFVSLSGLVDHEKEFAKTKAEAKELEKYILSLSAKLENVEFTSKAPESVVATMRTNKEGAQAKLEILRTTP